jgi:hypothetical protein
MPIAALRAFAADRAEILVVALRPCTMGSHGEP